jgi:hypothetical protein
MELTQLLPEKMFVYPVARASVQGRHNYVVKLNDTTTVPLKRTFAKDAKKAYAFPDEGGKVAGVMETMLDNPFYKNEDLWDKTAKGNWLNAKQEIISKPLLSLQTYLEIIHNKDKGFYTSNKNVSMAFHFERGGKDTSPTYLERFKVYLEDGTNIFTSKKIEDQIAMLCLKASF